MVFDRDGAPESGAVICTGAHGERLAAAVHDRDTLEQLTDGTGTGRHRGHGDRSATFPNSESEGYGSTDAI